MATQSTPNTSSTNKDDSNIIKASKPLDKRLQDGLQPDTSPKPKPVASTNYGTDKQKKDTIVKLSPEMKEHAIDILTDQENLVPPLRTPTNQSKKINKENVDVDFLRWLLINGGGQLGTGDSKELLNRFNDDINDLKWNKEDKADTARFFDKNVDKVIPSYMQPDFLNDLNTRIDALVDFKKLSPALQKRICQYEDSAHDAVAKVKALEGILTDLCVYKSVVQNTLISIWSAINSLKNGSINTSGSINTGDTPSSGASGSSAGLSVQIAELQQQIKELSKRKISINDLDDSLQSQISSADMSNNQLDNKITTKMNELQGKLMQTINSQSKQLSNYIIDGPFLDSLSSQLYSALKLKNTFIVNDTSGGPYDASVTDLNYGTYSGVYYCQGAANQPPGATGAMAVLILSSSISNAMNRTILQVAMDSSANVFIRNFSDGTWHAWQTIKG